MADSNNDSPFGKPHWITIGALAVVGLVQPALGMLGIYTTLGRTWSPLIVAALVAVCWVTTVVVRRTPYPLLTLVVVGGGYGILAVALNRSVRAFVGQGPASMPGANMVSIVLSNLIWGALLGLIALAILRLSGTRDRS